MNSPPAKADRDRKQTSEYSYCARPNPTAPTHHAATAGRNPPDLPKVGVRTRTIPPALRRALELRDGGCRFPGCGLRFTRGHHIVDWAKGGQTKLSNLVALCRTHHRGVHEDGFRVEMGRDGRPRFYDRTGWPIPDAPPPTRTGPTALERLIEEHRRAGADPAPDTPSARYKRRSDIPPELEDRAREALGPPGDEKPEE